MKIKLNKTVEYNGHEYKKGVFYTVTNGLGEILKELSKPKKKEVETNKI